MLLEKNQSLFFSLCSTLLHDPGMTMSKKYRPDSFR